MPFTLPTLLRDVIDAWSWPNLPYTIAFWAVIGVLAWLVRRRKGKKPGA